MRKISVRYKLQPSLLKQETEHDEIYEDTWDANGNERLPYVKNDVLATAFCYATYIFGMDEIINFSMKTSLTLPSLANKYFNSLRDENDQPIYTHAHRFMRNIVRNSIKGGRCALNQHYKSEVSDGVFIIISKKLNVNIWDLLGKYFEFLSKSVKLFAKEFDSKFEDYSDKNQKGKTDHINNKLNMLPIHEELSKLDLKKTQMDFHARSLYPSAMWDRNSVYSKIETGYSFRFHLNDVFVNDFIK